MPLDGFNIRKTDLEKRKNDDEVRGGAGCGAAEAVNGWVGSERSGWAAACRGTDLPASHMRLPPLAAPVPPPPPQVEEGWVQCDQCEGWVHQICGLFNKGRNDSNRGFLCPFCLNDGACPAPARCPACLPLPLLLPLPLPGCFNPAEL